MVNNLQWTNAWKTLNIAGVTALDTPPASLDRVKLPAGWPQDFTSGLGQVLVSCLDANIQRRIIYHIAMNAVGQKNLAINYNENAVLMDAIETALKTTIGPGKLVNFVDWQIFSTDKIPVAGMFYWGFEIQATGRNV